MSLTLRQSGTGRQSALWGLIALTGASAIYAAFYLHAWLPHYAGDNDFFVFWSASHWLREHGFTPGLYDFEKFNAFQAELAGGQSGLHPFPYPPSALIFVLPLSLLGEMPALVVFLTVTLIFLLGLVAWGLPFRAGMISLSPSALVNAVVGQNAFLTTGLIAGGLRLVATRPVVAGVMIGLMTIKPQLGLMVPVALVAVGAWRVTFVAVGVALVLAAIPIAFGGWQIWEAWFAFLPRFVAETGHHIDSAARLMVTAAGSSVVAGVPLWIARMTQIPITIAIAAVVFRICRRHGLNELSIAAICVASLLATPFAYFYDMMLSTFAVVILAETGLRRGFLSWELFAVALGWTLPILALYELIVPGVVPLSLLVLLAVLVRRLRYEHRLAKAEPASD